MPETAVNEYDFVLMVENNLTFIMLTYSIGILRYLLISVGVNLQR